MSKHGQFRKPKYETDYSKVLSRKVFYKPKFLLQELKLNPVTGSGHVSDVTTYDNHADLRDRMDDFLEDKDVRARLFNVVHRLFDDRGLACCLLRKMVVMEPLTVKKIDDYIIRLCKRFTTSHADGDTIPVDGDTVIKPMECLKYNERLVKDLEHLLPSDFEPKKILDISSTDDSVKMIKDRFPGATVYTNITDSDKYDLIIVSHYLHHITAGERTTLIKKIANLLDVDNYLFIREMDVETSDDTEMSNFIHEVFYKSRISTISYIPKDKMNELIAVSNELEFQSESRSLSDYFTNPLKNYFALYKKIIPKTESDKPTKLRLGK